VAHPERQEPPSVDLPSRWDWLFIVLPPAIVLGVITLSVILGPSLWRWSSDPGRPLKYPRDTAMMGHIVSWVHQHGDCDQDRVDLPEEYAAFTTWGEVSCWKEAVFLPQWAGLLDNAGGYWWSPQRSPEGFDMWGMQCHNTVDLGDGWWTCGMAS